MSWRRGLAGLIWGAVVMIAIQLVPTTVRAHTGHAHVAGEPFLTIAQPIIRRG